MVVKNLDYDKFDKELIDYIKELNKYFLENNISLPHSC